ncbi:5-oxoprolinase subunit PxpB [Halomonas daqiaonensis]|uniref:Sensor histidine kinase inhibitor, KipI family n=1 Tax=Halomonas daqiaonensis TaxID=650850 RepID=A0A1H7FBH2_9GAMM|nr:5-oxoprolinase subunit PxpB [Halomonas daqiaonensis]SEK20565.1 sensor histidine kinase inhibitor, KipI family [Halomonas daqiaonensis]
MNRYFPQGLPRLEPAGLDGWMVRLFDAIDEGNMPWLTALVRDCESAFGDGLVDLVPSYTTLLVVFDPLRLTPGEARQRLVELLQWLEPDEEAQDAPVQELPVWYDASVGPELSRLAELADMNLEEVVACHSERSYRVFALGFAPGFAFMGSVDSRIEAPRLESPRRRVPAGSVAVAGQQTAAYPAVTPGGWNLIGRTPTVLFDRDREGFSLLRVGDRVRFVPIDRAEFERLGGDPRPMEEGA